MTDIDLKILRRFLFLLKSLSLDSDEYSFIIYDNYVYDEFNNIDLFLYWLNKDSLREFKDKFKGVPINLLNQLIDVIHSNLDYSKSKDINMDNNRFYIQKLNIDLLGGISLTEIIYDVVESTGISDKIQLSSELSIWYDLPNGTSKFEVEFSGLNGVGYVKNVLSCTVKNKKFNYEILNLGYVNPFYSVLNTYINDWVDGAYGKIIVDVSSKSCVIESTIKSVEVNSNKLLELK